MRQVADAALETLYRSLFEQLVRYAAWHYGLSKDDAREVVQEAFLLAVERLDSQKNPKAWIYRVVGNVASNWRRKEKRRARLMAEWYPDSNQVRRGEGSEP